ncbi:transmembrane protein, putative [Rhizoctonia solani AG-3 Rhs1AP]|uniref:Transmembrane protein, putative n=2 Tax=Rhizoctonia solani AG-3 TaxID=1086053 RepID=X8JV11_9AGAM|nr:transmembrane protein, putative [Rhizoctonia solani AG-3 Rhs1AP]KEP54220.1 putative transmembrane protein [Rhizoctonia solani 123E]
MKMNKLKTELTGILDFCIFTASIGLASVVSLPALSSTHPILFLGFICNALCAGNRLFSYFLWHTVYFFVCRADSSCYYRHHFPSPIPLLVSRLCSSFWIRLPTPLPCFSHYLMPCSHTCRVRSSVVISHPEPCFPIASLITFLCLE